jgi:hypothetical protein
MVLSFGIQRDLVSTCVKRNPVCNISPSRREIGKLRTAILTGKYDGPDNWRASPLISAYGAYILGLILQDNPHANVESATKAYGVSLTAFERDSFPVIWLKLATAFNDYVKPRQFRQCLYSGIYTAEIQGHMGK